MKKTIYPEWLEREQDEFIEAVSTLEAELREHDKEFRKLDDEREEIISSSPALYSILDTDEAVPLDKEDAKKLLRIFRLDSRMREITDRAIFVYGRKDAYRFMRSIGEAGKE